MLTATLCFMGRGRQRHCQRYGTACDVLAESYQMLDAMRIST
jgi:hypothetical protein